MDGQVPQAQQQQQQASSGVDLVTQLLSRKSTIDSEIMKTLPSALAPQKAQGIPSPHIAGSFEFGVGQPQMPAPQGHRDARNQGIAKTIAGVANIVGQIKKAEDAKHSREFQSKVEKVLAAQDGVSQASQIPKDSPGYADAQKLIQKNQQIINDTISADPKTKKKFEKAFDINFVDPSQNDTPEHKAMQAATKSYAEQLAAKTPDKLVPNQQAQAKLQQLSEIQKSNDATIKAVLSLATQEQKDANSRFLEGMKQTGAANRASERNKTSRDNAITAANASRARTAELWAAAKLNNNTRRDISSNAIKAAGDRLQKNLDAKAKLITDAKAKGNSGLAGKLEEQQAALIQKEVDTMPNRISQLIKARDQDRKAGASQDEINKWDAKINAAKSQGDMYQSMLAQYDKENMNMPPQEQQKGDSSGNSTAPANVTTVGTSEDDSDDSEAHTDPDDPIYN
jgi:hypothetical protein